MNQKPNILVIVTDQLTWRALPAYGNTYCKTPNIDRIVKRGMRFDNAYTPFPLCQPARAAFWTGLYPHQTGVLSNGRKHFVPRLPQDVPTLGSLFAEAGYDTVHFGKTHDAGSLRGFKIEPANELPVEGTEAWPVGKDTVRDRYTTVKAVDYLQKHGDEPYLMVADMVNPHDICQWIGKNQGIHEDISIVGELPPLPYNFEFDDIENRPAPVRYICCSHNRQAQAAGWNDVNYRHYLAAYYHYINIVDQEIGLILDALEQRKDSDNTLIVFMADHGEGMASRGMVTKQVSMYDETTRVPLIFAGAGIQGSDVNLTKPLVSLLDLLPTLCDYAGIQEPEGLWGKSLMPLLKGESNELARSYVASEWHTEWGFTIEPGRMIRTQKYKYIIYREGDGEEFFDLEKDPGETKSLIGDPAYEEVIQLHRELLKKHIEETNDPFFSLAWEAEERWRSHKAGYHNHVGPAAPMVE